MSSWNEPSVWHRIHEVNDESFRLPLVWDYMDKKTSKSWRLADPRLYKLWSFLRPFGLLVPVSPTQFADLMFTPNITRMQILRHLFTKIYPDNEYWDDPMVPDRTNSYEISKARYYQVKNVCQWFGFAQDKTVIKGTSSIPLQLGFWFQIINLGLSVKNQQRAMARRVLVPNSRSFISLYDNTRNMFQTVKPGPIVEPGLPAIRYMQPLTGCYVGEIKKFEEKLRSIFRENDESSFATRYKALQIYKSFVINLYQYVHVFLHHMYVGYPAENFAVVKIQHRGFGVYGVHQLRADFMQTADNISNAVDALAHVQAIVCKFQVTYPGKNALKELYDELFG